MWSLKKCPKCHGDMYYEEYLYKYYEVCLQCGYEREIKNNELVCHEIKRKR